MNGSRVKFVEILFSHLFWPLVITVLCVRIVYTPTTIRIPQYESSFPIKIDKNRKPAIIAHLTDLHLNPEHTQRTEFAKKQLSNLENLIKPSTIIISGDLVDGTEGKSAISRHRQFTSNWEIYKEIFRNTTIPIIAAAGNHDEHALGKLQDVDHLYIQNVPTLDFYLNKSIIKTNNGKIRIVLINPYEFPTPPMPYGLIVRPSKKTMDKLEEILNTNESDYTFITSHFPSQCVLSDDSSSGKKFNDIIGSSRIPVSAYLAGHFHMPLPFMSHIGQTLQVLGSTTSFLKGYGLLSIDDGAVAYNYVNDSAKYQFAVTNPSPSKQFTAGSGYLENKFRVRVIVYSQDDLNMTVFIDDKEFGKMEVDLTEENYKVYGLDVETDQGNHKINIEGDISYKETFFVGKIRPPTKEKGVRFFIKFDTFSIVLIIIILFLIFTILAPYFVSCVNLKHQIHVFSNWVISPTNDKLNINNITRSIIYGPFFISFSFTRAPTRIIGLIFLEVISFFVVPMYFMNYDDITVVTMMWCILTSSGMLSCVLCYIVLCLGIGLYIVPFIFMASVVYSVHPMHWIINAELIILNFIPVIFIVTVMLLAVTGDGFNAALYSPLSWVSVMIYIVLSKIIWSERIKQIRGEETLNLMHQQEIVENNENNEIEI